jgi:hypothetical protein
MRLTARPLNGGATMQTTLRSVGRRRALRLKNDLNAGLHRKQRAGGKRGSSGDLSTAFPLRLREMKIRLPRRQRQSVSGSIRQDTGLGWVRPGASPYRTPARIGRWDGRANRAGILYLSRLCALNRLWWVGAKGTRSRVLRYTRYGRGKRKERSRPLPSSLPL